MTAAERARRAQELHETLNTAFPADNHDSIDEPMRVAMLTLSQDETSRGGVAETPRSRPTKPTPVRQHRRRPFWQRWLAALRGRRPA